MGSNYSDIGDR